MNTWQERQEDKKEIRESNAKQRAARTNQQQLAELDRRLGVGVGAKKERKRLSE